MKLLVKYCILFVVVCLMAGTGAYLAILAVTQSPEQVILPDLVEKDLTYVLETLTGLGLNTKFQGAEYSYDIPRNHVLTQFPAPGSLIKKGRDVMIRISKGKKEIPMPDLRRMSLHKAELLLENSGLNLGNLSRTISDRFAQDTVITQYPLPGAIISRGSITDLLVSRGSKPVDYVMPDLRGLIVSEAETRLSEAHLDIGFIDTAQTNTLPENTIMRQDPLPGTRTPGGSQINLTVNRKNTSRTLTADDIQGVAEVNFHLAPGFLNRQVRIEADLFETTLVLWEGYAAPGQEISVLIPRGITTDIRIFMDEQLIKTQRLTPWNDQIEGE